MSKAAKLVGKVMLATALVAGLVSLSATLPSCAALDRIVYVPPTNGVAIVQAYFTGSIQQADDACRSLGMTSFNKAQGCAKQLATGGWVLIAVMPKSFNDREALATIGEETVHIFGGKHLEKL